MTDALQEMPGGKPPTGSHFRSDLSAAHLRRRYRAERWFRCCGVAAVAVALLMLSILIVSIVRNGYTAFVQTQIALDIAFDPQTVDPAGTRAAESLAQGDYQTLVKNALKTLFPEVTERAAKKALFALISSGAGEDLRRMVAANPGLIGTTARVPLIAGADADMLCKGRLDRKLPEAVRGLSDQQLAWIDQLTAEGRVRLAFNRDFFTKGDSREPERAGILGALSGSFFTMLATLALSLPLGILSAIYLEEFAPRNRFSDFIEININNLAAVPSVVFGLLGLAIFLGFFGLPRSAPLVGGMVLSLMTLPTIIIATRAALQAVPPSIREAAHGIGASPMQVVFHHVLPLAVPGIMTGAIIGMARALGESAPLLMIGMVAFIADIPRGFLDPASVLPVQVFLWADAPERAFAERTSAAIIVLLVFLIFMNAVAVLLRRRFERRW